MLICVVLSPPSTHCTPEFPREAHHPTSTAPPVCISSRGETAWLRACVLVLRLIPAAGGYIQPSTLIPFLFSLNPEYLSTCELFLSLVGF